MYVSVSFSIPFIEMSLVFILYAIYPFLKSGRIYVNSADDSIYVGSSTNAPIKMVTELNIESYVKEYAGSGGPVTNPNWPALEDLTLGNNITWANKHWIVSHVTSTEAYLTLKDVSSESPWYNLQDSCYSFGNSFNEDQEACLKYVTAGNTSGIVFVATKDQMDGGFSYFNSDNRRRVDSAYAYWTSTERNSDSTSWYVDRDGSFDLGTQSLSIQFRPSVCIDLTLYT